jgi:hypothetical protein
MINDVTYKHEFFYYNILCIVVYTKKQNLIKFIDLKYT